MKMKEIRIDQIWSYSNEENNKTQQFAVNNIKQPMRHINIIPEDSYKIIERNKIIRLHETFRNEKNNSYTHEYMSTLYGLLFNNDKRYHIQRNKLCIINHKHPTIEINTEAKLKTNKTQPLKYYTKMPMNIGISLSSIPPILSQTMKSIKIKKHNDKGCNESIMFVRKNNSYNKNSRIKLDKRTKEKFNQMSAEKSRWLDLLHNSDEFERNQQETRQERLMKKMEWRRPIDVKYSFSNYKIKGSSNLHYIPCIASYNSNTCTQRKKCVTVFNSLHKKV